MPIHLNDSLPFAEYIQQCKQEITERRTDLENLSEDERQKIIDGNSPFILTPGDEYINPETGKYKRGILLTHGLTDSPFSLRPLAEFFRKQGFLVYALLLPGHGTRPDDLLQVTWHDWVQAQQYGLDRLAEQAEKLYLSGNSLGALLGLHQTVTNKQPDQIKGLIQFSPALQISAKARYACLHALLGKVFKKLAWYNQRLDEDPYKYESFPYSAACQLYKLIQATNQIFSTNALDLPVFIAASLEDTTVKSAATLDFFKPLTNQNKRMLLYSAEDIQVPENVKVVKSTLPDLNILSYSHVSLVTPPKDERYGQKGSYALCSHYFDDQNQQQYVQCMQQKEDYLGEVTEENLRKGTIRRLTYNPLFSDMLTELGGFIDQLPE